MECFEIDRYLVRFVGSVRYMVKLFGGMKESSVIWIVFMNQVIGLHVMCFVSKVMGVKKRMNHVLQHQLQDYSNCYWEQIWCKTEEDYIEN